MTHTKSEAQVPAGATHSSKPSIVDIPKPDSVIETWLLLAEHSKSKA